MKILQISNFFSPAHGGSGEVPYQLSKALAQNRNDVAVITIDLKENTAPKGVKVSSFPSWLKLAGFNFSPAMISKARQEIKKYDILHLHNYRTFQNIVAHHYAKKYHVPYVLQAHGSLTTYFQKGIIKRVFDVLWGNAILKDAAKVFAVTDFEAKQYLSMGVEEDQIEFIPHGVDFNEFNIQLTPGEFRKKFAIESNWKIVLYLGRIHKMKGLDILAKSFVDLLKERKDLVLVFAGSDDGYLAALKKLIAELKIKDEIVFTGPLYGKDKIQAYSDSDIYVLPSSYEIFGITILEAWACRKPVVVTDRCGLADAVKDNAGVVTQYDAEQLHQALKKLLDNPSLCEQFGRQGRKMIEEKYNWPKIALRIQEVYRDILTGST